MRMMKAIAPPPHRNSFFSNDIAGPPIPSHQGACDAVTGAYARCFPFKNLLIDPFWPRVSSTRGTAAIFCVISLSIVPVISTSTRSNADRISMTSRFSLRFRFSFRLRRCQAIMVQLRSPHQGKNDVEGGLRYSGKSGRHLAILWPLGDGHETHRLAHEKQSSTQF